MIGDSAAMKRLRLQIRRIGPHFRTVLISGEPGSGKETAARALHRMSHGADGPFIASASGNRISYLTKLAQRGTLFFHHINEMPLDTQDELLDILRRNEWAQDGLAAPQRMHPRIIASTNNDLRALTASARFRQELYQRIAMVQIALPPLRERIEDLSMLTTHFLHRLSLFSPKNITIANDAAEWLKSYAWPGNIRELENMLDNAALQTKDSVITAEQLPALAKSRNVHVEEAAPEDASTPARLQYVVEQHVLHVLKNCAGNKLRAAELLGISRSTLYRMLGTCSVETRHEGQKHEQKSVLIDADRF